MPRIPDSIKSPKQILSGRGALGRLYRHANELLNVEKRVRAEVNGDVRVAGFESGALHLVTPSAALATRLRYQQRRFIGVLEVAGARVTSLKVSVRPEAFTRNEPPPREAKPLSPANSRRVTETAEYIEDDDLREALLRLARHTRDEQ